MQDYDQRNGKPENDAGEQISSEHRPDRDYEWDELLRTHPVHADEQGGLRELVTNDQEDRRQDRKRNEVQGCGQCERSNQ